MIAPPIPGAAGGYTGLHGGYSHEDDLALQQALRASVAEDDALQRAIRESADQPQSCTVRRLMGPDGPFYPAGIRNSGNSCFWNALLQVLFAATPIFRGALFQQQLDGYDNALDRSRQASVQAHQESSTIAILGLLRDLFAEMDMGLVETIDAGELYRMIFQGRVDEADVNEQTHCLFEILSKGPGPVKAVFRELFSGDLYEHLREGTVRTVPLDFCQLDLCVTQPTLLENILEEHTRDVQGSIVGRSYRLPPVLWLNLDRFVYDREAQTGKKLQVRLRFPDVLNAWMLVPPEAAWVGKLRTSAKELQELQKALTANREAVARCAPGEEDGTGELAPGREESLLKLVEEQEALMAKMESVEALMQQQGEEQEVLYHLQAVIVHRGRVDSGHYYAYARSPCSSGPRWCCLNDSSVSLGSTEGMRLVCEGGEDEDSNSAPLPSSCSVGDAPVSATPAVEPSGYTHEPPSVASASAVPLVPLTAMNAAAGEHANMAATVQAEASVAVSSPDGPKAAGAKAKSASRTTKRHGILSSMSSMFGCLQKPHVDGDGGAESEQIVVGMPPERQPATPSFSSNAPLDMYSIAPRIEGTANQGASVQAASNTAPSSAGHLPAAAAQAQGKGVTVTEVITGTSAPSSSSPKAEARPRAKPREVTAARCLVYVRSSAGGDRLLGEVKNRVPSALQERIDARNLELLRASAERVAEDFACAAQRLSSASGPVEVSSDTGLSKAMQDALQTAHSVRTEGGMARARIYLLRECWRRHVPWLPEELCPTATPPDFRMHYGSSAKSMLLDALIKRGQHDVASIIVAETENCDSFLPEQVQAWLTSHNF